MDRWLAILICLVTAAWSGAEPGLAWGQVATENPPEPPRVTRAKRPVFVPQDWEGIYFNDLFRDGLVGSPPAANNRDAIAQSPPPGLDSLSGTGPGEGQPGGGAVWSRLIAADVLEDEIKRTVLRLAQDVTTPSKFQSDYLQVRQAYSMLSCWFAIIIEYQADVRWRSQAPTMQPAMARAAANARVSSDQSYQYARARLAELQQLMRGESPAPVEPPVESIEWPYAVGRSPIMIRLQEAFDSMKRASSSEGEFRRSSDGLLHDGQIVAALGQALLQPDMDDADDEDYAKLARGMINEALAVLEATRRGDQAGAAQAINRVERRCNNCHADWR